MSLKPSYFIFQSFGTFGSQADLTLTFLQLHNDLIKLDYNNPKLSSTYILQMSVKLANDVFLVPILTTCGGFITNFFFSPVTISGFLARIMSNTLVNNCMSKTTDERNNVIHSRNHLPTLLAK